VSSSRLSEQFVPQQIHWRVHGESDASFMRPSGKPSFQLGGWDGAPPSLQQLLVLEFFFSSIKITFGQQSIEDEDAPVTQHYVLAPAKYVPVYFPSPRPTSKPCYLHLLPSCLITFTFFQLLCLLHSVQTPPGSLDATRMLPTGESLV
jgi:hypothetical protein